MPNTHCLPSGSLGTGELADPNIGSAYMTSMIPSGGLGHGNIRGVIVYCHGLILTQAPVPYPIPSSTVGGSSNDILAFANSVVADGWIFIGPSYQEDFFLGPACLGVNLDLDNDTGNGSRYLASTLRWWDHVLQFIRVTYGGLIPVVPMGFSWGAMRTLQIASNNTGSCLGYIAHCPATLLSNAAQNFTTPADFNNISTSGIDLSATQLNAVSIPGIVGFGTSDPAVGYSMATTLGAGSNNVNVATVTYPTVFAVASNTGYVQGPAITLTGLSGGTSGGRATFSVSGTLGGLALNVSALLGGSGITSTGIPVVQSLTSQIIANAQGASQPVTSNSTGDTHEFTSTDATTYSNWVASTLDPLAPKMF